MSAERDLEPATEVRDLAMEAIEAAIVDGLSEAKQLLENVRRIASDPFGAAAPNILGPLPSLLVKSLKEFTSPRWVDDLERSTGGLFPDRIRCLQRVLSLPKRSC